MVLKWQAFVCAIWQAWAFGAAFFALVVRFDFGFAVDYDRLCVGRFRTPRPPHERNKKSRREHAGPRAIEIEGVGETRPPEIVLEIVVHPHLIFPAICTNCWKTSVIGLGTTQLSQCEFRFFIVIANNRIAACEFRPEPDGDEQDKDDGGHASPRQANKTIEETQTPVSLPHNFCLAELQGARGCLLKVSEACSDTIGT